MDIHFIVLYVLKIFVLVFSGIAFLISLILLFSEKLFLKISLKLGKGNLMEQSSYGMFSEQQKINQNIKTMGLLVCFLSVISLYYISKSFQVGVLTKIFAPSASQAVMAEILLKCFKYFLLTSLSFTFAVSFPMILTPAGFRRMEAYLQKKFHVAKSAAPQKSYNIDDIILKFHVPAGILTSILSAYIFFAAMTRFQIK